MKFRYGAVALPIVALGALVLAGCQSDNEANLGGQASQVAPPKAGMENLKTYGDAMKYQAEQAAKNRPGRGRAAAKSPPAPAPKSSEPEAAKEQPKAP
jgi:outer membrane murein-binding lipoprotein Lpp